MTGFGSNVTSRKKMQSPVTWGSRMIERAAAQPEQPTAPELAVSAGLSLGPQELSEQRKGLRQMPD